MKSFIVEHDKLLKLIKDNKVLIIDKGKPIRYTDEWIIEFNKWQDAIKKENNKNEKRH